MDHDWQKYVILDDVISQSIDVHDRGDVKTSEGCRGEDGDDNVRDCQLPSPSTR